MDPELPHETALEAGVELSDIELGLETFQRTYAEQGISSIALPQLGCGQGGLDWESQVRPLMERYLGALPIDVFIYIPPESSDEASVTREQIASWLTEMPTPMRYAEFCDDLSSQAPANGIATVGVDTPDGISASKGRLARVGDDPEGLFDIWRQLRTTGYLLPEDVEVALGIPAEPFFAQLARLRYVERARVVRLPTISYDGGSTDSLFGLPAAQGVQFMPPLAVGRASPQAPIDDDGTLECSANPMQGTVSRIDKRSKRITGEFPQSGRRRTRPPAVPSCTDVSVIRIRTIFPSRAARSA